MEDVEPVYLKQPEKMLNNYTSREDADFDKHNDTETSIPLSQELEEGIRDLCTLRKTIPQKCAELFEECLELQKPRMEVLNQSFTCLSPTDIEEWKKSLAEFDAEMAQCKAVWKENSSLPMELESLLARCNSMILLQDVQKGMGLNDTQELLFSGKRKHPDCETPVDDIKRRFQRPGIEGLPSIVAPIKTRSSNKKAATVSRIPKRKQDPVTPVRSSDSLRKKLFKKGLQKT